VTAKQANTLLQVGQDKPQSRGLAKSGQHLFYEWQILYLLIYMTTCERRRKLNW